MALQKYPLGLQDFKGLIQQGNLYVDKTYWVHQLITTQKYYFLSRPRRFGKSLLLSVLYYLFTAEKDLFTGLYIADKWEFARYPVLKISFLDIGYRELGLEVAICRQLDALAAVHGVVLRADTASLKLKELLYALAAKSAQKVVLLIDEYDKPIIDYLAPEDIAIAQQNRYILKSLYSVLKDADSVLHFVFITGVSKFSQVSIFSDLNNLKDISLEKQYNEICGISQAELVAYFEKELQCFDIQRIKRWYNGYRWHIEGQRLYNPFSLLSFFAGGGEYRNFWFSTGTPTFLMQLSKREQLYDIEPCKVHINELDSFDFENVKLIPLLFQTGYLTLQEYDRLLQIVTLGYPNEEVRDSYLRNLADAYMHATTKGSSTLLSDLLPALQSHNIAALQKVFNQAFAQIPYSLWQRENEHFYHAIIHLLFSLLGVYIQSEVHTKDGRADALVFFEKAIYCFEFKLDKSAEYALQQIKDRDYLQAYRQKGVSLYGIGVNFSSEKKAVEHIIWEEIL